ncbi:hypothetical protein ACUSIJ_11135 [Pseudochelatococcus sp. B33]
MSEAVEITTFRLADGIDIKAFIAANEDINAWLKQQPGFISRRICEGEDGLVVDMLIWTSVKDGQRAAEGIMTEMGSSPVHAAIDQSTVNWSISAVRFTLA